MDRKRLLSSQGGNIGYWPISADTDRQQRVVMSLPALSSRSNALQPVVESEANAWPGRMQMDGQANAITQLRKIRQ